MRPRHSLLLLLGFGLAACVQLQWEPIGPRRTAEIGGAERIGAEECGVCHEDVRGHEKIAFYHADCEGCHGAGSVHADSEAIADIRHPHSDDCLACHAAARSTHLQWGTGEHSRAGLLCSDCHDPHEPTKQHLREHRALRFADMDAASRLCVTCHDRVAAQLSFPSHHPVAEGAMGCISCHDPHEDRRVAVGDRTHRCASCHQDVMGPWIFEHPPVVEDCRICHDPHGAVADKLMETVQPIACLSCHTSADAAHRDTSATGVDPGTGPAIDPRVANTFLDRCTDCHNAIHGSYTDELLRH